MIALSPSQLGTLQGSPSVVRLLSASREDRDQELSELARGAQGDIHLANHLDREQEEKEELAAECLQLVERLIGLQARAEKAENRVEELEALGSGSLAGRDVSPEREAAQRGLLEALEWEAGGSKGSSLANSLVESMPGTGSPFRQDMGRLKKGVAAAAHKLAMIALPNDEPGARDAMEQLLAQLAEPCGETVSGSPEGNPAMQRRLDETEARLNEAEKALASMERQLQESHESMESMAGMRQEAEDHNDLLEERAKKAETRVQELEGAFEEAVEAKMNAENAHHEVQRALEEA